MAWNPTQQLELYAEGSWYQKGIYRKSGKYPKYDVYNYDLKYKNASAVAGMQWTTNRGDLVTADVSWNKHAYYHAFTSTTLAEGFDEDGNFILDYPYFTGQKLLMSNQERTMFNLKGVFALNPTNKLSAGIEARYDYLKAPASIKGRTADDNTEAIGIFRFQVVWIKEEIRHLPTAVLSVYADFYRRTETGLCCTDQAKAYPELLQQDRLSLFSYRYILSLCRLFSYL